MKQSLIAFDTDHIKQYVFSLSAMRKRCAIDLALSGGRKGMSAMAMFAAQKAGLRYVYHTLIIDESLERKVQHQTCLDTLNGMTCRTF